MQYETVIGLEVHAQLATKTKLFCGCAQAFGAPANAQTCEVCLGMPGTLPALNGEAVALALRAALALGCQVHEISGWSRKNYFYPDLPKGYQITQFDRPYATGGVVRFAHEGEEHVVNLTRIHMEEDAGKNVHDDMLAGRRSWVDYNRGGTPLIEIVSEPELRSAPAAASYLKALRQLLRAIGACDGNMDQGSLRCDANVSLRPVGREKFGTRVELKNINSFRFVQQAIDYEVARQAEVLDAGGTIVQETRLWDTQAKMTRAMRSKEEAHDYRYFPEPDLPDLVLTRARLEAARKDLPELPQAKVQRFVETLQLTPYDARVLVDDSDVAAFFEAALAVAPHPKAVANWTINELLRELKERTLAELPFGGAELGELVGLVESGAISGKMGKEVFAELMARGGSPRAIVEARGMGQISDEAALGAIIDEVLAADAESVARYRAGKTNVMGHLMGQVMQRSGGRANPKLVSGLLRARLEQPAT
jgi:aspartyl-tRNA(Asn)/glutamyl-tRNA(Gln) amidotransferase subunit B